MAFLAQCPLAAAVGAAGRKQMCWTYTERCAQLLAPACPACHRGGHAGWLAHVAWDQLAEDPVSFLPLGSWPVLAAGV